MLKRYKNKATTLFYLLLMVVLSLFAFFRFLRATNIKNRKRVFKDTKTEPKVLSRIAWAIRISARLVPWVCVCRHQSWMAEVVLDFLKISHTTQVGFKKNDAGIVEGHCWTTAGGVFVTGTCDISSYTLFMSNYQH
jgi:hypothetical protein